MRKILDNKFVKMGINIIESILLVIICLYLLFVVAQRIGNNKSIFGYRVFTVASSSMEPAYMINDVVYVKDVDVDTLKVGDDIAYNGTRGSLEGKLVSHRIIKIEQGSTGRIFFTQGVNNENPDPSITEDQIVGRIGGKIPIINQINHLAKNQYGFFFLIFCPLVLVISLEIAETVIRIKIDKEELVDINSNDEDDSSTEELEKEKEKETTVSEVIKEEVNEKKNEGEKESSNLKKDVVIDEEII